MEDRSTYVICSKIHTSTHKHGYEMLTIQSIELSLILQPEEYINS
jgi:hypothetical protein